MPLKFEGAVAVCNDCRAKVEGVLEIEPLEIDHFSYTGAATGSLAKECASHHFNASRSREPHCLFSVRQSGRYIGNLTVLGSMASQQRFTVKNRELRHTWRNLFDAAAKKR